jgi:predicted nucleic acid-binding protein
MHSVATAAIVTLILAGHELFITPQVIVELAATLTRPVAANGLGLATADVSEIIAEICRDFEVLQDNARVFTEWLDLFSDGKGIGREVYDMRIVAAMRVHGIDDLLTFNVDDFRRYATLNVVHPADISALQDTNQI